MDWESHTRWAQKVGISKEAAQYVNRIIDIDDKTELPSDYVSAVKSHAKGIQQDRGAKKGNSALHMVIADSTLDHDSSRKTTMSGDMAAEIEYKHLKQKGTEYVAAWYLHHHLDYLSEERNSGKSLDELLAEHEKKYPETYSGEVARTLREHREELEKELGL